MMQAQSRAWTVALACSALWLLVAANHSFARTSANSPRHHKITRQKFSMPDGSQKLMADKTVFERRILFAHAERLDAILVQDLRRAEEAARQMMKRAKLIRNAMQMIIKDEQAMSRAQKTPSEGHGILERSQMILAAPRL